MTQRYAVGERVEVHTGFDHTWNAGFEIAEVTSRGYRLRRTHDQALFPNDTHPDDIRPTASERTQD